jgi:hypothetical protein
MNRFQKKDAIDARLVAIDDEVRSGCSVAFPFLSLRFITVARPVCGRQFILAEPA